MSFFYTAEFMKQGRIEKRMSQTELGLALDFGNGQFISNIERGKCSVPLKKAMKLCELLGVSPAALKEAMMKDYALQVEGVLNADPQL